MEILDCKEEFFVYVCKLVNERAYIVLTHE